MGAEAGNIGPIRKAEDGRTQNAIFNIGRQQTGKQNGDAASGENTRRKTGSEANATPRVCAAPTTNNDKTARRARTDHASAERTGRVPI